MKEFDRADDRSLSIVHPSFMICRHPLGPINHAYGPDMSGMDRLSPGLKEMKPGIIRKSNSANSLNGFHAHYTVYLKKN